MATGDTHDKPTDAYELMRASQGVDHVELDGKRYDFKQGEGNMFRVKDRGLAMAIAQKYPKQVLAQRVNYPSPADRGHKYTFTVPELPWKKGKPNATQEGQEQQDHSSQRVGADAQRAKPKASRGNSSGTGRKKQEKEE